MTTYIALFNAYHKSIPTQQSSCFIWRQESGEIDMELLAGKIIRESAMHFYELLVGVTQPIKAGDISVKVMKTELFKG